MTDEEKKFKASHFENIDELIKTCKMWVEDDDWDAYCRFFDMGAMEELINLIEKQSKEIEEYKILLKKQGQLEQETESLIRQGWLNK